MGRSYHIKIQRQKKVICGVNDSALERKFYNGEVLVENLDEIKKKDKHKVDMSIVIMKLSAVGKRMEKVSGPISFKSTTAGKGLASRSKAMSVPSKLGHSNL